MVGSERERLTEGNEMLGKLGGFGRSGMLGREGKEIVGKDSDRLTLGRAIDGRLGGFGRFGRLGKLGRLIVGRDRDRLTAGMAGTGMGGIVHLLISSPSPRNYCGFRGWRGQSEAK